MKAASALENYRRGKGVDPLAGAEAVISHLVVRTFKIPCAHAPALSALPLDPHLSPRSAAEEIGYTFLPCVLAGLGKAPQLVTRYCGTGILPAALGKMPAPIIKQARFRVPRFVGRSSRCGGDTRHSLRRQCYSEFERA
jgi:hypothetical protein